MGRRTTYPGLDLIRLAAAVSVAFYHYGFYHPTSEGGAVHQWASSGWCGVHIFFVISGFVIAFSASRKSASEFVRSRAARLYPSAWLCATITMILAPVPLIDYLRSLVLFPIGPWVSGVYWTLAVEIAFYALIALSLWRRWSLHAIALVLGWFSVLCWVIRLSGLVLPVGPFGHYGCYFALGMLLFERRSPVSAIVFYVAGIEGVYFAAADLGFGFAAPFVWAAGTVLCVGVAFFNEAMIRLTSSWPTRTIGLMTYPLYLIHDSFGSASLRIGMVPALAVSLATAFAILPLETAIRAALRRIPVHSAASVKVIDAARNLCRRIGGRCAWILPVAPFGGVRRNPQGRGQLPVISLGMDVRQPEPLSGRTGEENAEGVGRRPEEGEQC